MQIVFASMVVFDTNDIRLSISTDEDALRSDLIEFYNDCLIDEGDDGLDPDASIDELQFAFADHIGANVIIEENGVWTPEPVA